MLKKYPNLNEGDLSKKRAKIINFKTLAKVSKKIKINEHINTGKSLTKINDKMLSDCYESIIGAIFLDSSINEAEIFIKATLLNSLKDYETEMNFKGKLIELCLKKKKIIPLFVTKYNPNKKIFQTRITINSIDEKYISNGRNKKESEKRAAKKALDNMILSSCNIL